MDACRDLDHLERRYPLREHQNLLHHAFMEVDAIAKPLTPGARCRAYMRTIPVGGNSFAADV